MRYRKDQLKMLGIVLALTLCATGEVSIAAYADQGDGGRGYGRYNDTGDSGNREGYDRSRVVIEDNDRQFIRRYMNADHHRRCPPGLAKKHNGCQPPGQTRRYEIGKRLSPDVTYVLVPYSLRRNLRPPQLGYEYVRVDDDVLLMSKTDRTIVDAVALLSDLSR